MTTVYALWRAGPSCKLPAEQVFQLLEFGEDVEGLFDLPIQEMIAQVREIFPKAVERAGVVEGPAAIGSVSVTWSWQWMRLAGDDFTPGEVAEISQLAARFSCTVFETETGRS